DMMGIPDPVRPMVYERTNIILGLGDPEYTPTTPTTPTGLFAGMCRPSLAEPSSSFMRSVRSASVSSGR
ncbi:cytochrome P450, partial [Spirillospora sp. NPDC127506]